MMKIKERMIQHIEEYNGQLDKLDSRVSAVTVRLEELQIEISFIQLKEMPEAVERRVLTGDKLPETKVRKTLEKLQIEQQELNEELLVLGSVRKKFLIEAYDKSREIYQLFREEQQLEEQQAYQRVAKAKEAYLETIKAAAVPLKNLADVDLKAQQIAYNAGRTNVMQSPVGPGLRNNLKLDVTSDEINKAFISNI